MSDQEKPEGNSVKELKDWFGKGSRPVSAAEMMTFWKACSEADKAEFQAATLN